MTPVHITKQEAADAVRAGAFQVEDLDSREYGRRIVHCFRGCIGADWDEDDVISNIGKAEVCAWIPPFCGHELAVQVKGEGVFIYDIKRPDERNRNND